MFQREFKQLEDLNQEGTSAIDAIWQLTDLLTKDILNMLRLIRIVYQFLSLAFRNKYVQKALKKYVNRYLDVLTPIWLAIEVKRSDNLGDRLFFDA